MNGADLVLRSAATAFLAAGVGMAAWAGSEFWTAALDRVEDDLTTKLRRLHLPAARVRLSLVVWLLAVLVGFVVAAVLLGAVLLPAVVALGLLAVPWWFVRRLAQRRAEKLEDQLADAMTTMASAIKAGLSLTQALGILAEQSPRPISEEFRQIVGENKLGKPLEQTLEEAKQRLGSENFALFAAAVLAARESGGRLNETIERIATSVRELQRLERKVQSETAQARKSATYMALVPAGLLLVYNLVDPKATALLFTSVPGQLILAVCVVLNVLAYFWARAILNPDI